MSMTATQKSAIKAILRRRLGLLARHYQRAFMPDGVLSRDAEIVLADLRHECFATRTTRHESDAVMREREALRRLYLRITRLLNFTEAETSNLVEIDYGPEYSIDD